MSFLGEIKRRKVFQVAAVYAVVAWLTIQIIDVVGDPLKLPYWFHTVVIVLFAAGFPIAVILAWAFDVTPQGIKAASDVQVRDISTRPVGHRLNYLTQGLVLIAVGFLVLDQYVLEPRSRERLPSSGEALEAIGGSTSPEVGKPAHLLVALPEGTHLAIETEHPTLALSPDGSRLVFVAEDNGIRRLYMRELAEEEARPMTGTEGAAGPFFSPDGSWIGFFSGSHLKKIAPDGGIPITIRRTTGYEVNRGATWTENDTVIFVGSADEGLSQFSVQNEADGSNQKFTFLDSSTTVPSSWPDALPGGRVVLFSDNTEGYLEEAVVAAFSLDTGDIKRLINGATSARYSSTGHILFARGGSLFAAPFGAATIEVTGTEFKLVDGVVTGADGAAQFAVTDDGTLAYVAGESSFSEHELVWVDRDGSVETLLDNDRRFLQPRLSPDGTSLAVMSPTGPNLDVWVLNLERGNFTRWTSHPGEDFGPVWGHDGRLAFSTEIAQDDEEPEGGPGLGWMTGPGQPTEHLLRTPGDGNWDFPTSWSPDGRWLLYTQVRGRTAVDIYLLETQPRQPQIFLSTPFKEAGARFSPNGHWVAYVSDQSGRREVYLRSFPDQGSAQQMSTNGGQEPVWSRDGHELFYREGDKLMAVTLGTDATSTASPPRLLFEGQFEKTRFGGWNSNYDVSPDGKRFIMIRRKNPVTPTVIHVVLNWPKALGIPTN
jgi:serine/threonine-protein kinase